MSLLLTLVPPSPAPDAAIVGPAVLPDGETLRIVLNGAYEAGGVDGITYSEVDGGALADTGANYIDVTLDTPVAKDADAGVLNYDGMGDLETATGLVGAVTDLRIANGSDLELGGITSAFVTADGDFLGLVLSDDYVSGDETGFTGTVLDFSGFDSAEDNIIYLALTETVVEDADVGLLDYSFATGNIVMAGGKRLAPASGIVIDNQSEIPAPPAEYATWDEANKGAQITITGDGLIASNVSGGSWNTVRATIGFASGNHFYETLFASGSGQGLQGIQTASGSLVSFVGGDAHGWGYYSANGQKMNSGGGTAYADPYATGARIGVRFTDTILEHYLWNGSAWDSLGQITHGLSGEIFPACSPYDAGTTFTANFGQDQTRTPPDGASWCGA